jgi:hypothetical protein
MAILDDSLSSPEGTIVGRQTGGQSRPQDKKPGSHAQQIYECRHFMTDETKQFVGNSIDEQFHPEGEQKSL